MADWLKCRQSVIMDEQECVHEHTWMLRQRVRQLNQQTRRARIKQNNLGLTLQDRQVACFIYEVSGSMIATVLWVVNKIPRTLQVLPCRHDMEEVIRLWISTTKASTFMAWRDPITAPQYRIRQKTHEFIAEANLFQWLTNQNSKGVVPSSRLMITEFLQRWPWPEAPKVKHLPNSLATGSENTLRNWAWRFRGRWGLKIGKLPLSPDVSPQEIKHKAWIQNVTPFLVQKSTPIQGSHRLFLYSETA
jgi:hypothetical protein